MMRSVALAVALMFCSALFPFIAGAYDPPHYDPATGNTCVTCHTSQLALGSTGYNNICLNCHRPGDPAAGGKPITLADAANPFGTFSTASISRMYQTSHRWDGSDTNPAAGAQPPVQWQMTTNNLRTRTGGQLACVRCHNQHSNTYGAFLRMPNDQDQLCLDCHRSRNVQSHFQGSHPVNINYAAKTAAKPNLFNSRPLNANPSNPTSNLFTQISSAKGLLLCSTCHGVHYTDSRSGTADGHTNFANLSSDTEGFLLRTDRRGVTQGAGYDSSTNICTTCHAGKTSHNLKGQDIQCNDCHGAHVEYDPNDPAGSNGTNIYLIRRVVTKAGQTNRIFFRYTGSQREYKNSQGTGICQGCHDVPTGSNYPDEHSNPAATAKDCNACHNHNSINGSFSGACTTCHGYPPTTASLGGPTGLAVPATGATPTSPGAHVTHAKKRWMACNTCHTGYAGNKMPSGTIDIGFSINGNNFPGFGGTVTGGIFNSTTLNSGYSWSAANGTTITAGNSAITCNVYCHGTTLSGGSTTPPTWTKTDGSQKACGACHWVSPGAAPAVGGHIRHAGNGTGSLAIPCASCHGAHDNNDHVNGSVNWDLSGLSGGGAYKGAAVGSTGAIAPSAVYGQCTNLYCHSPGTSLQGTFAAPGSIPTWGGTPLGCDGCHDGLKTGPAYPNGTPKANSHAAHVVTSGYGCNTCHYDTTTNGTTITAAGNHVNRAFNLAPNTTAGVNYVPTIGTPSTPSRCDNITCHGGNSATWGASLGCQGCHLGASDNDVFSIPFSPTSPIATINTTEWAATGHGRTTGSYSSGNPAADLAGANQCLYCHDNSIGHNANLNPFRLRNFSNAAWGKNGVCLSCHATGAAGVTIDGVTRTATKRVDSAHYGYDHTSVLNGGQFCWDCHDAHGDGNLYMIHNAIYPASDATTGVPVGTPVTVSFTAAATGTDYARSAAPFNGICNVCHTTTSHYTSTSGDGHNAATRCTVCHPHTGIDQQTAFVPNGGVCDSCHGYPPASAGFSGTQNNWSSARLENYPGGGGAHMIAGHVSKTAKPADKFAQCNKCHNQTDHIMSPIIFKPGQNIKISVNQGMRYEAAKQARYTSNRLDGASHQTGTCSNISCHFGATPKWDPAN